MWRFEATSRKATPKGQPSSLAQHRLLEASPTYASGPPFVVHGTRPGKVPECRSHGLVIPSPAREAHRTVPLVLRTRLQDRPTSSRSSPRCLARSGSNLVPVEQHRKRWTSRSTRQRRRGPALTRPRTARERGDDGRGDDVVDGVRCARGGDRGTCAPRSRSSTDGRRRPHPGMDEALVAVDSRRKR
jgi:hypothetical protein